MRLSRLYGLKSIPHKNVRFADFKCDDIIIGGDYNLVLDLEKDKMGGLTETHQTRTLLVAFKSRLFGDEF